ncbi:MAG: ComEA family DNA-binding protein [Clostridia bacterium]|nr:ComEA family DNA-binding protein [Clostridia bacterium]
MSERKHELLLIAAALFISAVTLLYSVLDSPKYNNLEALTITATVETENTTVVSEKININTADISELMQLEEIGENKAASIIEYRKKNGKFRIPEEITNVSGIGEGILAKNIDRIIV